VTAQLWHPLVKSVARKILTLMEQNLVPGQWMMMMTAQMEYMSISLNLWTLLLLF